MLKKEKIVMSVVMICMGLLFTACHEKEHKPVDVSSEESINTEYNEKDSVKSEEDANTETEETGRQLLAPASVYSDLEKAINKLTTATDQSEAETEEISEK